MKSKQMQVAKLKDRLSAINTELVQKGSEYVTQKDNLDIIVAQLMKIKYEKGCIETELMMLNNIQEDES